MEVNGAGAAVDDQVVRPVWVQALAACSDIDPACGAMAKRVYDFTQDASRVWLSSNKETKQRLLRAFSLNRTVTDVTLCLEKRKPFSCLTERLPVRTSRGDKISLRGAFRVNLRLRRCASSRKFNISLRSIKEKAHSFERAFSLSHRGDSRCTLCNDVGTSLIRRVLSFNIPFDGKDLERFHQASPQRRKRN